MLSRRSRAPVVADTECCLVDREVVESPMCMFDPAGGPRGADSRGMGGPAGSSMLSRRSWAPVIADKERFLVAPEVAESPTCMFDPAGGLGGVDSRGLGWPAGVNLPCC